MSRTVYVNGTYVPEEDAKVSIFDRGFLMADAVYEVTSVIGGKLIDFAGHCARLRRSLSELELQSPADDDELLAIHRELVKRNEIDEGMVYLQVTRGVADRSFGFEYDMKPTLVMFTQALALADTPSGRDGIKVITVPDIRWGRRDIKTVQLLAPSLCKMAAKKAGAGDAWMVEDDLVTEGTSNNAYIVTKSGTIVTRQLSQRILHGITRKAVTRLAREAQIKVEERPFSVTEAAEAAEAFYTSASGFVTPVVALDGKPIGDGKPGPVTRRLREIYIEEARRTAI